MSITTPVGFRAARLSCRPDLFRCPYVRFREPDPLFGARNLAAYPEGRAVVWRRFVSFLDAPGLSAQEQDAVVAGAAAAFERFGVLLKRHFALD